MAKIDYSALDAAILKQIGEGAMVFQTLRDNLGGLANSLAPPPTRRGETNGWRVIDRRLQALSKAGHIVFSARRWSLKA